MAIKIKPSKRGTFTRAAKSRGQSVQGFASKVLANPDNYSPAMRKKAQFAHNAAKFKHADGGQIPEYALGGNVYSRGGAGYQQQLMGQSQYNNQGTQMGAGVASQMGPIGGIIGAGMGIGSQIGQADLAKNMKFDTEGNLEDKTALRNTYARGSFFDPFGSGMRAMQDPDASTGEKIASFAGFGAAFAGKKAERAEKEAKKMARKQYGQNRLQEYAATGGSQQYGPMSFANGGKVKGRPYESVTTPIYKPVTARTVYLENKKSGVIPADVKFKDFAKDPTPYLKGMGREYKYDPKAKTGTTSGFTKLFEDVQEGVTGKQLSQKGQLAQVYANGGQVPAQVNMQDLTYFIEQEDRLNDLLAQREIDQDYAAEQAALQAQPVPNKVVNQDLTYFINQEDRLNDLRAQELEKDMYPTQYAMGGQMPMPQAEVEGGETAKMPNGEDVVFEGPSHAQGGIPFNGPGAEVYSDRIGPEGTKQTYSDINKKYIRKNQKANDILSDPYATSLAKKTAAKNLANNEGRQRMLFVDQERAKIKKDGYSRKNKKFEDGGTIEPWMTDLDSFGVDRMVAGTNYDQLLGDLEGNTNLADLGKSRAGKALGGASRLAKGVAGQKDLAGSIAQAAPALYNIGQGLFGKADTMDASDFANRRGIAALQQLKDRRYDVDPELAAIERSSAIGRRNIASGARSRGELLGGYQGLAANEARAKSDVLSRAENMRGQYLGQYAQAAIGLGSEEAATKYRVSDYNARARAAKQGMLGTGLSQLSQLSQVKQRERGLREADRMRIGTLQTMYPNYRFNPKTGTFELTKQG